MDRVKTLYQNIEQEYSDSDDDSEVDWAHFWSKDANDQLQWDHQEISLKGTAAQPKVGPMDWRSRDGREENNTSIKLLNEGEIKTFNY